VTKLLLKEKSNEREREKVHKYALSRKFSTDQDAHMNAFQTKIISMSISNQTEMIHDTIAYYRHRFNNRQAANTEMKKKRVDRQKKCTFYAYKY